MQICIHSTHRKYPSKYLSPASTFRFYQVLLYSMSSFVKSGPALFYSVLFLLVIVSPVTFRQVSMLFRCYSNINGGQAILARERIYWRTVANIKRYRYSDRPHYHSYLRFHVPTMYEYASIYQKTIPYFSLF